MSYRFIPPHSLILDVFAAAVLLTILGPTSFSFIQALVDFVFVPERKPAVRSYLLPRLSRRIKAERMHGRHSHPLGLPLNISLNDSRTFCALAIILGVAVSSYILTMNVALPDPGAFRLQGGPVPIVIEVSGRIRDVYMTEGSAVHVGDVLVQLDTTDLLLRKSELESQIHLTEVQGGSAHVDLFRLYHQLGELQLDMERHTITSPADGEITSLEALHSGNVLQAGTAIAVIFPRKVAVD